MDSVTRLLEAAETLARTHLRTIPRGGLGGVRETEFCMECQRARTYSGHVHAPSCPVGPVLELCDRLRDQSGMSLTQAEYARGFADGQARTLQQIADEVQVRASERASAARLLEAAVGTAGEMGSDEETTLCPYCLNFIEDCIWKGNHEGAVPEPVPPAGAAETRHIHNCMRCGLDFECRNEGHCTAQYRVLPKIVQGYELVDHCPPNPTWDEIRELISERIQQYDNRQQATPPCWKDIPVTWADGTTGVWKCRKERGHSGVCAAKNCCDARDSSGDRTFCGFANNHAGNHAWALPKSLPEPVPPGGAATDRRVVCGRGIVVFGHPGRDVFTCDLEPGHGDAWHEDKVVGHRWTAAATEIHFHPSGLMETRLLGSEPEFARADEDKAAR